MKNIGMFSFLIIGLIGVYFSYQTFVKPTIVYEINNSIDEVSIDLKAGKTIQFKFHDDFDNSVSICELRVPDNYNENVSTPIFVWFSPGKGSYKVNSVPKFVDFSEYFVLALPYLNNQLPRHAIDEGTIDDFWDYNKPMLEMVIDSIPNLSSNTRIAAGFSSGAHYIGTGLDKNWYGFTDFFTGYILHEGGYSPTMKYNGIKASDKILVSYGGAYNSYGKVVAREMLLNHENITVFELSNTKHEIDSETVDYITSWIDKSFNINDLY